MHIGTQTMKFNVPVSIFAGAAIGGKKEGEGPLRERFDSICSDSYFGQKSWEKAESTMLKQCFDTLCTKSKLPPDRIQYLLAGDLQSQCTGSAFAARDSAIPYFGLYGACSTMGESMSLGAILIESGAADAVCAMTSSHFCSAERQFRLPLEYGGQRTPTAQWTATAAGAVLLRRGGPGPRITHITTGRIVDAGVTDANNMGAAMAPVGVKVRPCSAEAGGAVQSQAIQGNSKCRFFHFPTPPSACYRVETKRGETSNGKQKAVPQDAERHYRHR